jgi:hypothetical protein
MTCDYNCFDPLLPDYEDMARSLYTANGSATDFVFAPDYIGKDTWDGSNSRYIRVYRGNDKDTVAEADFTMPNSGTIRISPAPASGEYILLLRDSKPNETLVDFQDANVLAEDCNLAYQHLLHCIQELNDRNKDVVCMLDSLCERAVAGEGGPIYTFQGDCSTAEFELTNDQYGAQTDLGVEDVWVYINGIEQTGNYTIDNTVEPSKLVFAEGSEPVNLDQIVVRVVSNARTQYQVVETGLAAGAVTTNKIADGAVTAAKLGFTGTGTQGQVWRNSDGTNWAVGTILAADVSGFDTKVRTSRIDQMVAPTGSLSLNAQKIVSLANGTDSTDAINLGQLNSATSGISDFTNKTLGGVNQDYVGIAPDLYFRSNADTDRAGGWATYFNGVQPKVATTSRSSSEKICVDFLPREIKLYVRGAIRRNASSTIIHSATDIERVLTFTRWDESFGRTPTGVSGSGDYRAYSPWVLSASTGASSPVTNITFSIEMDFVNYDTWLYINGNGFGSELMRITDPSDNSAPGIVQIIAIRGY